MAPIYTPNSNVCEFLWIHILLVLGNTKYYQPSSSGHLITSKMASHVVLICISLITNVISSCIYCTYMVSLLWNVYSCFLPIFVLDYLWYSYWFVGIFSIFWYQFFVDCVLLQNILLKLATYLCNIFKVSNE